MATKAMSDMGVWELIKERDKCFGFAENTLTESMRVAYLILANQYDAELTRRREGKTI